MKIISRIVKKLIDRVIPYIYHQIHIIEKKENERFNNLAKMQMKSCGQGVGLWGNMKITGINQVSLGNNVHIGENAFIRAEGGLTIGDNTHISRNLVLYTMNHDYHGNRLPYDEKMIYKSVFIGKNVWIGMNVCITPGTIIHDGVIIGMGTTVSGEVPPLSIIGGEKWRILGHRNPEHYELLDHSNSYSGVNGVELD